MSLLSKSVETSLRINTMVVEDRFDITVFSAVLEIVNDGKNIYNWSGINHFGVDVPSGVYFFIANSKHESKIKKVMCIK